MTEIITEYRRKRRRRRPVLKTDVEKIAIGRVWGIDLSSTKLAITHWDDSVLCGVTFVKVKSRQEMNAALELHLGAAVVLPGHAFIEEEVVGKGGAKVTIAQARVAGVAMYLLEQRGWTVSTVNNRTWKRVVVGNGNASKPQIRSWFEANGPSEDPHGAGRNEDTRDAYCVGQYGLDIVRTARAVDAARRLHRA